MHHSSWTRPMARLAGRLPAVLGGLVLAGAAQAQSQLEIIGQPVDGAMGFQPSATNLAVEATRLDHLLLIIITVISVFVMALLLWCIVRYNRRVNPVPGRFTHNTPVEIAWTVVPVVILVFIGSFSLPVLLNQQEIPEGDVRIKATGYQWYWGYEYIGEDVAFDSIMIGAGENRLTPEVSAELAAAGYTDRQFLLATDTAVVVPVGKDIVVEVTAADVIHSWKMPALGVMQDAVPGRHAALWFRAEQEGIFFGQCSELCGISHAYMPITVKVVSEQAYAAWLAQAKTGDVILAHTPVDPAAAVDLASAD
jgi:cytochrome c oxidase subunit II